MNKDEFSRSDPDPLLGRILASDLEARRRRMKRPELGEILDLSSRSSGRTRTRRGWALAGAGGIAAAFLFFLMSSHAENVDSIRRSVGIEKQALFVETQAFMEDSWYPHEGGENLSFNAWTDFLSGLDQAEETSPDY